MTTALRGQVDFVRDAARRLVEKAFAARFVWTPRSPSLLMTSRMRMVLLCAAERNNRYVFHLTEAHRNHVEAGPTQAGTSGTFVALACGPGAVFVLPYRDLREWRPQPTSDLPFIAHAAPLVVRRLGERYVLSGPPRVELNRYRMPAA